MRRAFVALVATAMMALGAIPASASANDLVFPPGSAPYGQSYAEWEADWQIWYNEIPIGRNPLVHPDSPENCAIQPGGVAFIGGSGGDHCSLPQGTPFAFAGGFWECSTGEGLGETYPELRRCAIDNFARDLSRDTLGFTIRIDGEKLQHPRRWTFLTSGEVIDFPRYNIWRAEPGPSKSITKGFFYIVRPLPVGEHEIRVHVNDTQFGTFNIVFTVEIV